MASKDSGGGSGFSPHMTHSKSAKGDTHNIDSEDMDVDNQATFNRRMYGFMENISTQLTEVARVTSRNTAANSKKPTSSGACRDPSPSDSSSDDLDSDDAPDYIPGRADEEDDSDDDHSSSSDYESAEEEADQAAAARRLRRRREVGAGDIRRAQRTMRRLGLTTIPKKKSKRKSGLALGADINVWHVIDWPHHLVRRHGAPIEFDQLSAHELTAGLMAMADKATSKGRLLWAWSMRQLSHHVLEDAGRLQWPAVRSSPKEVFLALEQGRLSWEHFGHLNRFRQTEMLMPFQDQQQHTTGAKQTGGQHRSYPCIPFQKGECTQQQATHRAARGTVKHICAYCYNVATREYNHGEHQCRRKQAKDNPRPDNA